MKEITVDIDANGNTKVTTKGFEGAECLQATAALEAALGVKTSLQPTPEMHKKAQHQIKAR